MTSFLRRFYLLVGRRILGEVWYARKLGVRVGSDCSLFSLVYGSEPWLISIGSRVQITDGVRLLTHGGGWTLRSENPSFDSFGAISIGDGTYIGNSVIVLPGVSIGNCVVVAAGSVVTKSVPNNVVIGGNPARVICSLKDYKESSAKHDMGTAGKSRAEKMRIILSSPDKLMRKPFL